MAQYRAGGLVRTARGRGLDMNQLARANESEIAVTGGGLSMNARGDILGRSGKVVRSREDLERAYNEQNAKAAKHVAPKSVSIRKTNISPDRLDEEKPIKREKTKAQPEFQNFTLDEVASALGSTETTPRRRRKTTDTSE